MEHFNVSVVHIIFFILKSRGLIEQILVCEVQVRIAVFQAIDAMVRCGLTATSVAQDLAPGTKSLAFDHATAVREVNFLVLKMGTWK